jgi:hypothetical protein
MAYLPEQEALSAGRIAKPRNVICDTQKIIRADSGIRDQFAHTGNLPPWVRPLETEQWIDSIVSSCWMLFYSVARAPRIFPLLIHAHHDIIKSASETVVLDE